MVMGLYVIKSPPCLNSTKQIPMVARDEMERKMRRNTAISTFILSCHFYITGRHNALADDGGLSIMIIPCPTTAPDLHSKSLLKLQGSTDFWPPLFHSARAHYSAGFRGHRPVPDSNKFGD